MATGTTTNAHNTSTGNAETWVQTIYDTMIAGGWRLVPDSGDMAIPISIGFLPGPGGTFGYLIFGSNDSGGGLNEFFVKISLGQHPTTSSMLYTQITIGWGSDGAGNITGTNTGLFGIYTNGTTRNSATSPLYVSADSGSLCISLWENASSGERWMFSIERTKDSSFDPQNRVHFSVYTVNDFYTKTISETVAYATNGPIPWNWTMPALTGTPVASIAGLGEVCGFAPGSTSPSLNILGVEISSAGAAGGIVTVQHYGASHSYLIVGDGTNSSFMNSVNWTGVAGSGYLMRYE